MSFRWIHLLPYFSFHLPVTFKYSLNFYFLKRIADFDQDKIYAFLVSTSGTTGKLKLAAFKHRPVLLKQMWLSQMQYKSKAQ